MLQNPTQPAPQPHSGQPEDTAALRELYARMEDQHIKPLWTQIGNLMPKTPTPRAVPHLWKWADLIPLARRSGDLVPVGRGGERRALGLANPASAATPTSHRPCGARSSISVPARPRPNTGIRRTPSASSWKARGSGRSSTATPFA